MVQLWTAPVVAGDTVGGALLTKVNDALASLRTVHSGATAPTVTAAYMLYQDTALKEILQRDSGDATWQAILASNVKNHGRSTIAPIHGIAASNDFWAYYADIAFHVDKVYILSDTTTSGSDGTNRYEFQVRNVVASLDLIASDVMTDAVEVTADTPYVLTLDQNQNIAAGDALELQVVKTGAPTDWTSAEIAAVVVGWLRGA